MSGLPPGVTGANPDGTYGPWNPFTEMPIDIHFPTQIVLVGGSASARFINDDGGWISGLGPSGIWNVPPYGSIPGFSEGTVDVEPEANSGSMRPIVQYARLPASASWETSFSATIYNYQDVFGDGPAVVTWQIAVITVSGQFVLMSEPVTNPANTFGTISAALPRQAVPSGILGLTIAIVTSFDTAAALGNCVGQWSITTYPN